MWDLRTVKNQICQIDSDLVFTPFIFFVRTPLLYVLECSRMKENLSSRFK